MENPFQKLPEYDAMVNDSSKIVVNTGLSGFVLIDGITEAGTENINGIKIFADAPIYLGIESLAQLGAYHVRFLTHFEKHSFMLKITRCKMPEEEVLNGRYLLYGMLTSRSESAFTYKLQAKKGNETCIEGDFLYATVDYSSVFKKEILQDHYQKVFSCLQNDIKIN